MKFGIDYMAEPFKSKLLRLLDEYGVDLTHPVGSGAFKCVFTTNIPDTVLMITTSKIALWDEIRAIKELKKFGYPVISFYWIKHIENVSIILAEKLYEVSRDKTPESILEVVKHKVKSMLNLMAASGHSVGDLQYLVDKNFNPVFHDPMDFNKVNVDTIEYDITVVASCKAGYDTYVSSDKINSKKR